jgi:hypothetical protein
METVPVRLWCSNTGHTCSSWGSRLSVAHYAQYRYNMGR